MIKYALRIVETSFIILTISSIVISLVSCNNGNNGSKNSSTPAPTNDLSPKLLSYSIINAYPHDTSSFTEGLEFYKGELYESTGLKEKSKLMKTDLTTGKALKQINLAGDIFGEGITILRDTIYQLTYTEKAAFAYRVKDFKKIKEYTFSTETKEGWGMTNDGENLIATDGGSNLYFFQPSTFTLLKKIAVSEGGNPAFNLNEVQYLNGFIYANQWQYNYILKIEVATGKVVAKYDLSELTNMVKAKYPQADVLNGIAYNETTKNFYVTGKNWPELYEIQLGQ
jgi:glutamine cyclotransferase